MFAFASAALVRSVTAVANLGARNPHAAAAIVAGVGGLAAVKAGEIAGHWPYRLYKAAKRQVHSLTAEKAQEAEMTVEQKVDQDIEEHIAQSERPVAELVKPALKEVKAAAVRVRQQIKRVPVPSNGSGAKAAKAA